MMDRYLKMKKSELLALARQVDLKGRSGMSKEQLARALADLAEAVEPEGIPVPASVPAPGPGPAIEAWAQLGPPTPELPVDLMERRLCLLPQAPRMAFAYWETGGEAADRLSLRVLSAPTGDTMASYTVSRGVGSFYVHLDRPGLEIEVLLGTGEGTGFRELLRSNRIRLPDEAPSEDLPTLWMTRRRDYEEIFRLSGGAVAFGEEAGPYGARRGQPPLFSWPGGRKGDA